MKGIPSRTTGAMLLAIIVVGTPIASCWGQDGQPSHRKASRHDHRQRAVLNEQALTVTRPPQGVYAEPYVGGDPSFLGQDPEDAYGDITGFNPEPSITSGVQYPYGLDGVGGWGSDLGFEGEQSSSVYQRASGSP